LDTFSGKIFFVFFIVQGRIGICSWKKKEAIMELIQKHKIEAFTLDYAFHFFFPPYYSIVGVVKQRPFFYDGLPFVLSR
jgi:hypothetical protein